MNFPRFIIAAVLLGAAVASAAPRDRIDPKDLKDTVSLKVGSKGVIQFKQQGDAITEPKLVQNADPKEPGVTVEFKKNENQLMLALQNQLPKALRYRAAIRLKGRREFVETSLIVPVMAGLYSFESWQDPIEELVLFDFKLTDEKLK
jgi:hypothetical protein